MAKAICTIEGENIFGTVILSQVRMGESAHFQASPYAPTIIDASINGLPKVTMPQPRSVIPRESTELVSTCLGIYRMDLSVVVGYGDEWN